MPEKDAIAALGNIGLGKMVDQIKTDLEILRVNFDVWFREKSLFANDCTAPVSLSGTKTELATSTIIVIRQPNKHHFALFILDILGWIATVIILYLIAGKSFWDFEVLMMTNEERSKTDESH
jgi:hypothetical protein